MTLKKVNNWLLAVIVVLNLYVIAAPLLPALLFHWQHYSGKSQKLSSELKTSPSTPGKPPQPNRVIIPSMLLDGNVLEGALSNQYKILDQGIWRWPKSSTPDKGGNTVLIGHRFTYTNPKGVFYFLNKVNVGDSLGVVWNNRKYVYSVSEVKIVRPNDISIEDNTREPRLTLFTCTPLWLPKDRLVVIAEPEKS